MNNIILLSLFDKISLPLNISYYVPNSHWSHIYIGFLSFRDRRGAWTN